MYFLIDYSRFKCKWLSITYLLLIVSSIQTKVIESKNCLPLETDPKPEQPKRYQRLFMFSNSKLRITPRVQVPFDLQSSIETGFTASLPITVKFQSQVDLMTNWMRVLLADKTQGLSKNIDSFRSTLAQFLAVLYPQSNGGPTDPTSAAGCSAGTGSPNNVAGDGSDATNSGSATFAANNTKSNFNGDSVGHKDYNKILSQNKMANNTRAEARNKLYKSIELSHSTLGKTCLQRAICEVSQTPLMSPNTGLIGEILDMLLSVNSLHEPLNNYEDYMNAQTVGQNSYIKQSFKANKNISFVDECRLLYGTDCPFSLFKINHIIPINV